MKIPVVVQHRHVHLSTADEEALFGKGKALSPARALEHQDQVVYHETVDVVGTSGRLERVRVLGPAREKTQVEVSATDAFALGIEAPVRVSGDLTRSGSCELIGPAGKVKVKSAVIIPARHLHCPSAEAKKLRLVQGQILSLTSPDGTTIEHVTVRIHPTFRFIFHLAEDEAAEYWLHTGDHVTITL